MTTKLAISDDEWFEAQFDPTATKARYGIEIPSFPSDHSQITFTGMSGRDNLRQAFSFYNYVKQAASIDKTQDPRVMDFGAGWGRIARLWLREVRPKNIVTSDTMPFAIKCLNETGGIFHVVENPPYPPIPDFDQSFDAIYAYSVFSHLSEPYTRAWVDYLLAKLRPGGVFVFTTRGTRFISDIDAILQQTEEQLVAQKLGAAEQYLRQMRRAFPASDVFRERFAKGEFQFVPLVHAELAEDCTGETIIPKAYFEKHYPNNLVGFDENVPYVDQSVVTLRR